VPTFSAAKGMFEAVARLANGRAAVAEILPSAVEVCCDIRYHSYSTNYGGPLRKPVQIRGGNNFQLPATVLVDVCYRVYGVIEPTRHSQRPFADCHQLQEMFERRLKNGQNFYCPALGWREFVPSYFGPFRPETRVNTDLDLTLPSFLHSVFDAEGRVSPLMHANARIDRGVLRYERRPALAQ
jgi:CRISPR-associated protein Cas5d